MQKANVGIISAADVDSDLLTTDGHSTMTNEIQKNFNERNEGETMVAAIESQNEEITNDYTCHICTINIPMAYVKQHYNSLKHKTCMRIVEHALDRMKRLMTQDLDITANPKIATSSYFCDSCAEVININNRTEHETSRNHTKCTMEMKQLNDLLDIYSEGKTNFEPKAAEVNNNHKPLEMENDDNYYLIENNNEIEKQNNEIVNTNEKETDTNAKKNMIQHTKPPHSFIYDGNDSMYEITTSNGKVKVPVNDFHGFYGMGNCVVCRICRVVIEGDVDCHKLTKTHFLMSSAPLEDVHCVRKIDGVWNHCILCNDIIEDAQVQSHLLRSEKHTTRLKEALLPVAVQNRDNQVKLTLRKPSLSLPNANQLLPDTTSLPEQPQSMPEIILPLLEATSSLPNVTESLRKPKLLLSKPKEGTSLTEQVITFTKGFKRKDTLVSNQENKRLKLDQAMPNQVPKEETVLPGQLPMEEIALTKQVPISKEVTEFLKQITLHKEGTALPKLLPLPTEVAHPPNPLPLSNTGAALPKQLPLRKANTTLKSLPTANEETALPMQLPPKQGTSLPKLLTLSIEEGTLPKPLLLPKKGKTLPKKLPLPKAGSALKSLPLANERTAALPMQLPPKQRTALQLKLLPVSKKGKTMPKQLPLTNRGTVLPTPLLFLDNKGTACLKQLGLPTGTSQEYAKSNNAKATTQYQGKENTKKAKLHYHVEFISNMAMCKVCNIRIRRRYVDIKEHVDSPIHLWAYEWLLYTNKLRYVGRRGFYCMCCDIYVCRGSELGHINGRCHKSNPTIRVNEVHINEGHQTIEFNGYYY